MTTAPYLAPRGAGMIVSVDRTVEVEALIRGAVIRATSATVDAGGKGVNLSRAWPSTASGPGRS